MRTGQFQLYVLQHERERLSWRVKFKNERRFLFWTWFDWEWETSYCMGGAEYIQEWNSHEDAWRYAVKEKTNIENNIKIKKAVWRKF